MGSKNMSAITIYHNPNCSKSRATLDLIKEKRIEPIIVEYLVDPPTPETIKELINKLGLTAREIMREKEKPYSDNNLSDPAISEDDLLKIMSLNPILIERPIVVKGARAVLGRPPENIMELL